MENRKTIGNTPLPDLQNQMLSAFSRMPGEKVISYLVQFCGRDALLTRDMAHDMLERDVASYEDLGLDYTDDFFPRDAIIEPIDLGIII